MTTVDAGRLRSDEVDVAALTARKLSALRALSLGERTRQIAKGLGEEISLASSREVALSIAKKPGSLPIL
ncbi:MAG TPA: hypothetical protein VIG52_01940 [Methyloceanibacter sp.]